MLTCDLVGERGERDLGSFRTLSSPSASMASFDPQSLRSDIVRPLHARPSRVPC